MMAFLVTVLGKYSSGARCRIQCLRARQTMKFSHDALPEGLSAFAFLCLPARALRVHARVRMRRRAKARHERRGGRHAKAYPHERHARIRLPVYDDRGPVRGDPRRLQPSQTHTQSEVGERQKWLSQTWPLRKNNSCLPTFVDPREAFVRINRNLPDRLILCQRRKRRSGGLPSLFPCGWDPTHIISPAEEIPHVRLAASPPKQKEPAMW